jgi:hypothetical protein
VSAATQMDPKWPPNGPEGTQMEPKLIQNGPKGDPRSVTLMSVTLLAPKMEPSWCQLAPKWNPNGPYMTPKGSKMDPKWTQKGPQKRDTHECHAFGSQNGSSGQQAASSSKQQAASSEQQAPSGKTKLGRRNARMRSAAPACLEQGVLDVKSRSLPSSYTPPISSPSPRIPPGGPQNCVKVCFLESQCAQVDFFKSTLSST